MENYLARTFKISSFDLDPLGQARLTSLAGFFQEMAYLHASRLGFGFRDLEEKQAFWVLSRMKIGIIRYPEWDEEVKVETWHNGVERLFGLREFRVVGCTEEPLVLATSAWLILDAKTRRAVKPDESLLEAATGRGFLFDERLDKIEIPAGVGLLGTRKVVYSDLDIMGHVNNARYIEWCIDLCMEQQLADRAGLGCNIRELEINYTGEALPGTSVEILGTREPTGTRAEILGTRELPGTRAEILGTREPTGGEETMLFLARDAFSGREVFRARLVCGTFLPYPKGLKSP